MDPQAPFEAIVSIPPFNLFRLWYDGTASGGNVIAGTTTSGTGTGGNATGGSSSKGGSPNTGGSPGTGGSTGTGGSPSTGGTISTATGDRLPQEGNPVHARFDKYKDNADKIDNILSYQQSNGGWPKNINYTKNGSGGNDSGTFDNGATTMEMTAMADACNRTGDIKYCDSARKALDYIFKAQYPEGGWPQFYPLTGGYHDHVTYNYKPTLARAYEHPSVSGSESIEIIGFLMYLPQTPAIKEAVIAAVDWFNSPTTYLADYTYNRGNDNFEKMAGSRCWARFYDLETNKPIFSNYDGKMWVGLEYQDKKKSGYRWGGDWGEVIIKYAKSVGYLKE